MKKWNLERGMALLTAAALLVTLAACQSKTQKPQVSAGTTAPAAAGETNPIPTTEPAYTEPTIVIDQVKAKAGDTVTVGIYLKQSPGIAACRFLLEFDNENLELQTLTYGPAFAENGEEPAKNTSPMSLMWSQLENVTGDQLFAELTFRVSEDAKLFSVLPITVKYAPADLINLEEEDVAFSVENGFIEIAV